MSVGPNEPLRLADFLTCCATNTDTAASNGARAEADSTDVATDDDEWQFKSQADIFSAGVSPVLWDFEGLLEGDSGPVLLFGPPDSLKTWLAISVAYASVTGGLFLGQFPVRLRHKALYLNFDAGGKEFERRVAMLGSSVPNFYVASPGAFSFERLERALSDNEGSFVVLDCFADIYVPDRQSEPGRDMRAFVRRVRGLYERYRCNGIIVDHSRRPKPGDPVGSERYYGSIQKRAAFRQMWYIERLRRQDEPKGSARAKVICDKLSEAERFKPFIIDFTWTTEQVHATYGGLYDEATAKGQMALKHREMIEPYMDPLENPDGVSASVLVAKSGLSPKRVREALKTGGIVLMNKGRAARYKLAPAMTSSDEEADA